MQDPRDFILLDEIDKNGPNTYSRTYQFQPAELKRDPDVAAIGPLVLEAHVQKGDLPHEYRVGGSSKFSADLNCSRCAEPYPFASSSEFHLRFRPQPEVSSEDEEIEITPGDLDMEFYADRSIPLRELALEQIHISIPMKPLHDDKCLGLCPQCGANRNSDPCACATPIGDQRWGALHDIREQIAKKRES